MHTFIIIIFYNSLISNNGDYISKHDIVRNMFPSILLSLGEFQQLYKIKYRIKSQKLVQKMAFQGTEAEM